VAVRRPPAVARTYPRVMPLVRCTCMVDLVLTDEPELRLQLADPECPHAAHRAVHDPRPDGIRAG
jgi:hypothetical protein